MMTPMQRIQKIKLEMSRKGWTNGGEPGGFKLNEFGMTVALAQSEVWVQDMEAAIGAVDDREGAREALRELERRGLTNQALGGALHEGRPGADEAGAQQQSFEAGVSRR
jgi:hypothetical protein